MILKYSGESVFLHNSCNNGAIKLQRQSQIRFFLRGSQIRHHDKNSWFENDAIFFGVAEHAAKNIYVYIWNGYIEMDRTQENDLWSMEQINC